MQITRIGADGYIESATLDMRNAVVCRVGLPAPPGLNPEQWRLTESLRADSDVMRMAQGLSPDVICLCWKRFQGK
jgi:hypothetical protein